MGRVGVRVGSGWGGRGGAEGEGGCLSPLAAHAAAAWSQQPGGGGPLVAG